MYLTTLIEAATDPYYETGVRRSPHSTTLYFKTQFNVILSSMSPSSFRLLIRNLTLRF